MRCTAFSATFSAAVIAACGVGCDPATDTPAPNPTAQPVAESPAWEDELYEMVRVLDLTIAEEDAVRAAYQARDAEVQAFMDSGRGKRLSDAEAELADAVRSRDLSAVRAITDRAGGDRDALRQIVEEGKENIRNALPQNKRVQWDAYQVSSELLALMEPLTLTPDQQYQIEEQAVLRTDAALARNEPNPKAAAFLSLEEWAENVVLNVEQRGRYESIKKENPLRSLRI